jgi:hypothetical protein
MEFVLHDWNDDLCVKLLRNITEGTRKRYSILIANQQLGSELSYCERADVSAVLLKLPLLMV